MDIKEIRQKMKLTQQDFACVLGVSISTVARWELGKSEPSKMAQVRVRDVWRQFLKEHGNAVSQSSD